MSVRHPPSRVHGITTTTFTHSDIKRLALQRTESLIRIRFLRNVSPTIFAWSRLRTDILLSIEAWLRRKQIVDTSILQIYDEVEHIAKGINLNTANRICDIGCGLAIDALFLSKTLSVSHITLIDIETSKNRHHGFHAVGAGYTSLDAARNFLQINDPDLNIETLNPNIDDINTVSGSFDLICSLLSCGFHFPTSVYLNFFRKHLSPEGRIVLDLRKEITHPGVGSDFVIEKVIKETETYKRAILKWPQQ